MSKIRRAVNGTLLAAAGLALICSGCDKPSGQPGAAPEVQQRSETPPPRPEVKCDAATPGGPEDIVRRLYENYSSVDGKALRNEPREELEKYLAPRFRDALLRNQACEHNTGDLCGFDYDIMYNTQDTPPNEYKVCKMVVPRNVVTVTFRYPSGPESVTYQLERAQAGWRIADIVSRDENEHSSLVEPTEKEYEAMLQVWKKAQGPDQRPANGIPLPDCAPAPASGPEALVRALYEQYPWKEDQIIFAAPRKALLQYFDKDLTAVIESIHARRKAKGPSVYYSMRNIIVNNDMNMNQQISAFGVCAMDAASHTARAIFRIGGEPVVVVYQMKDTPDGMRISDIYIPAAKPEPSEKHEWSLRDALREDN